MKKFNFCIIHCINKGFSGLKHPKKITEIYFFVQNML